MKLFLAVYSLVMFFPNFTFANCPTTEEVREIFEKAAHAKKYCSPLENTTDMIGFYPADSRAIGIDIFILHGNYNIDRHSKGRMEINTKPFKHDTFNIGRMIYKIENGLASKENKIIFLEDSHDAQACIYQATLNFEDIGARTFELMIRPTKFY